MAQVWHLPGGGGVPAGAGRYGSLGGDFRLQGLAVSGGQSILICPYSPPNCYPRRAGVGTGPHLEMAASAGAPRGDGLPRSLHCFQYLIDDPLLLAVLQAGAGLGGGPGSQVWHPAAADGDCFIGGLCSVSAKRRC